MLIVSLHGVPVGTIAHAGEGRVIFVLDRDYVDDPQRPTLTQSILLARGGVRAPRPASAANQVPAFFANMLPEGPLRHYLAVAAGIPEHDEYGLLAALGEDLPGAVTVQDDGVPAPLVRARRARADAARGATGREGQPLRFSLAGVQLKFSAVLSHDAKGLTIPVGGVDGDWIVKLPSAAYPGLTRNEHAIMTLAERVGITVPEHRLVPIAAIAGLPEEFRTVDDVAYAIRRYDRVGPTRERIHQEDFAQVFRLRPSKKYESSYARILRAIAQVCPDDVDEFVRRLTFSIAVGNSDAHTKNFSLLYADRVTPRLAPAYDLVSVLLFLPEPTIGLPIVTAKRFASLTFEEMDRLAEVALVPKSRVRGVVRETADAMRAAVSSAWADGVIDDRVYQLVRRMFDTVPILAAT